MRRIVVRRKSGASDNRKILEPVYKIVINGRQMPAWLYDCVTKVSFKEGDGEGTGETLDINFDDPELKVMDSGLFVEKETHIVCYMGYLQKGYHGRMITGYVEAVDNDYPQNGIVTLKVTVRGVAYKMSEGDKTKTWKGKTYSDIVTEISAEYGLNAIVDDTNDIFPRSTTIVENVPQQPPPQPQPQNTQTTHTVKGGDCLWNLARRYYGKGSLYMKIFNANRDKIKNPDLIYNGQVLVIPDIQAKPVETPPPPPPEQKQTVELATVNQSAMSDLKFLQHLASLCNYRLKIKSSDRVCYFLKPENAHLMDTIPSSLYLDYKCGNERLISFKPKFNDYKKAMAVMSNNINIDNNKLVIGVDE